MSRAVSRDYRYHLKQAQIALQRGDRSLARKYAQQAARIAPDMEAPWLFMAAVSDPAAGFGYIARALEINPQSSTANKAWLWLQQKQDQEKPARDQVSQTKEVPLQPEQESIRSSKTVSRSQDDDLISSLRKQPDWPPARALGTGAVTQRKLVSPLFGFLIVLTGAMLVAWARLQPAPEPVHAAAAPLIKASLTATPTNTLTPTPTFTPTPTSTATPTATITPLPTETWFPNERRDYIADPQDVTATGRWIDVDLSEQKVYAYEGDEIVQEFLVSTGTSVHPTLTGTFVIWRKYVSTHMSGPGYSLPNVPFTMYYHHGYSFHGAYWHDNWGTQMSHGCINMRIVDSEWLFGFAELGTFVNVHP